MIHVFSLYKNYFSSSVVSYWAGPLPRTGSGNNSRVQALLAGQLEGDLLNQE
jgi:hypothetical protein